MIDDSRFCEVLKPGGIFVNGDLFDFWQQDLAKQALEFGMDFIRAQMGRAEARESVRSLGRHARDLRDQWVAHMLKENLPLPVEDQLNSAGSKGLRSHSALLKESGFSEIAVPFRHWQDGVLWGRRG